MSQLTLLVNGKEYALTEDFKSAIERRAEREFSENEMFDCWWSENERGDPILNIETVGPWVPWDRLEHLEFEMQEVEQSQDTDDSGETEDIDAGNGVKSVPKDDVDMDAPPTAGPSDDEEEEDVDTTFMVTPPNKQYIPQPESEDPEKIPPDPEEIPDDPSLVAWIPDDHRTECWTTGKALLPQELFIEWNVQVKADEAPEGATKIVEDGDGGVRDEPRTTSHDLWEQMCETHDCEVIAEKKPNDTPSQDETTQPDGYSGREPDETLDGKYGGRNWNV